MQQIQHHQYTLEQYFDMQRSTELKLEYNGGPVLAMAGGSLRHNLLNGNVLNLLKNQLRGSDCANPRSGHAHRDASGLYTYADASVIWGSTTDQAADTKVEHRNLKTDGTWATTQYASKDDVLLLPDIGVKLPLAEI